MSTSSQYYRVTARVGVPHRYEVEVTVPLVGPAGATGATGASTWNEISGKPATFPPSAHEHQPDQVYADAAFVSQSGDSSLQIGIYLHNGTDNGRPVYESPTTGDYIWWDSNLDQWYLTSNTDVNLYYLDENADQFPWETDVVWNAIPPQTGNIEVDQAFLSDISDYGVASVIGLKTSKSGNASSTELVLGSDTRLTNSRTPSSTLAHAASHHTSGSDALAPANIGAAAAVHTHTTADITGLGTAATEDFASPPAIGNTTPNSGAFTSLSANNGTLTASAPVLDLAQTWNNAAVLFTGAQIAITDTASNTDSELLTLKRDATTVFRFRKSGQIVAASTMTLTATGGNVIVNGNLNIGSSNLTLAQDAANTLAQRRTTNPQTFRLYNTYTSATNFERLNLRWASNVAIIGTEKGSVGGSARALELQTDGVSRWTIATNGTLSASSASRLNVNSLMFQHYGTGNALIGENCEYAGAWRYIAAGAAGMFYFYGSEGQFRFFASGSALAALPNGGNSTQFKVNADGTVALGGNGSFSQGNYSDNTLSVNSTTATFKDAANIAVGTTTGTKIGTATTQKLGFFNATPVVQQAAVADATDAATAITQLNDLLAAMRTLGLIAT